VLGETVLTTLQRERVEPTKEGEKNGLKKGRFWLGPRNGGNEHPRKYPISRKKQRREKKKDMFQKAVFFTEKGTKIKRAKKERTKRKKKKVGEPRGKRTSHNG